MSAQQARQVGNNIGKSNGKRNWQTSTLVIGVFVIVFGFLTITSFTQQSPTIDEPVHLLGGYSYLKWGDFRVNPEHPPLVKMWAALPLLWMDVHDPRPANALWKQILGTEPGGPVYPFARDMFFARNDAARLFFYAKLQIIILSIVLGIFVYLWSCELFGIKAAIVSLFLYGLDPNILAHSAIIHTDLPFAVWFFIGTYFFCRALTELTWVNLLLATVVFGCAAITKHSFMAIVPVWVILGMIKIFSSEPQSRALVSGSRLASSRIQKMLVLMGLISCAAIAAYFSIWAVYGFRFNAVPGGEAPLFMPQIPPAHKSIVEIIRSFLFEHRIFPEALISGYLYNFKIWKHSAYLLGKISEDGFWSYFPIAFAVKTPLPTLLMLAVSAGWGWMFFKKRLTVLLWLIIPALVYFALAVLSRFNLGIRHLLPIYPFLFVLIGATVHELWREGLRSARGGLLVLGFWYLWSAVSSYPHYLSFFNELAGGPEHGHKVLLDSNLDWGQDLKGLKRWMERNGVTRVQLVYFGTADPKYYGIDDFYSTENLIRSQLPASRPVDLPEHLAVSANFLFGGELFLPGELAERFRPYRSRQPIASIGSSLLVYRLNLADPRVYEDGAIITARKGALNLAEALLDKALQLDRGNANAYFQLANLMARQGKFDDAVKHYREAVRIKPDFGESYLGLGRVMAADGRFGEAIEYFRAALRIKPEYVEAHENLGQALARQGRVAEAAQHYQEALRILRQNRAPPVRDP